MGCRVRWIVAVLLAVVAMVAALCLVLPDGPLAVTAGSYAVSTPPRTATPTLNLAQVCSPPREAEHGVIQPPMVLGSDPGASNGQCVYTTVPYDGEVIVDSGQGPGAYFYLWGRVAGNCQGTYEVQVVEGEWMTTTDIPCGPWSWQLLRASRFWWAAPRALKVRLGSVDARLDALQLWPDTSPPPEPTPGAFCQETVLLQQGTDGYTGCADTYLYEYRPDTNYCQEEMLTVGRHQQEASLIRFDLSSVPPGTVLTGGRLQLFGQSWGGARLVMDILRVVREVDPCGATWNQAGDGNPWTLPGCNDTTGDRDATAVGRITGDGIGKWFYVDLTSLAQGWVNGTVPNHGLLIRQSTFPETTSFVFASAQNSDPSHRPKLVLTYWTVPPIPTPTPTPTSIPTGPVTVQFQQGRDGYDGCEDTYLYQYAPTTNYCTSNLIEVGYHQWNEGLVRFDVGTVPASASISAAALQLYAAGWDETDMGIDAFYITSTLRYCEATWNQSEAFVNWGLPGCNDTGSDRRAIPESTVMTSGFHKWYSFDLTEVVQGWVDGRLANSGVLLRASAYPYTGPFEFYSAQYSQTEMRPKLVITYTLPSATPTATILPSPTSTASPIASATPTPTETPPGDWMLSGRVYDAALGPPHGVSGATVSAVMCMPRSFQTVSEADGSYSMLLPALYLNQCVTITLQATAPGYQTLSLALPVADLRAQPVRDLALIPLPTPTATPVATPTPCRVWIPMIIKTSGRL